MQTDNGFDHMQAPNGSILPPEPPTLHKEMRLAGIFTAASYYYPISDLHFVLRYDYAKVMQTFNCTFYIFDLIAIVNAAGEDVLTAPGLPLNRVQKISYSGNKAEYLTRRFDHKVFTITNAHYEEKMDNNGKPYGYYAYDSCAVSPTSSASLVRLHKARLVQSETNEISFETLEGPKKTKSPRATGRGKKIPSIPEIHEEIIKE